MTNAVDFSGKPFHFIGIGGIGMSAIAQIVTEQQLPVSGSDLKLTHITQRLQDLGAHVFWAQVAENLNYFSANNPAPDSSSAQIPQVVCSTAIGDSNPEYRAALELGCPIFHRSDILAALIGRAKGISVAGTHGKTTTSGMIGYMLVEAGLDPTIVIGGEVAALGGNARTGQGDYLVAEADESDGSLVKFQSHLGVITNIELDHLDHYSGLDHVIETFQTFADRSQAVIGCWDCPNIRAKIACDLSYSLDPANGADYSVTAIDYAGDGTIATVVERGEVLGQLKVALLGSHNLANALAAVAVGRHLGLAFETVAGAIATYQGAKRRFELKGIAGDIVFVDDYAHHPSELQVTLDAARLQLTTQSSRFSVLPKRIVAIFQPHRYSRTQALIHEFSECFGAADEVVICDVYSAGEKNTAQITGQTLVDAIAHHHRNVRYCASLEDVSQWLKQNLQAEDMALFMGAGNLNQVIPPLIDYFADRPISV
jgi:UDP-N-acetylmuramate--alanine ligase